MYYLLTIEDNADIKKITYIYIYIYILNQPTKKGFNYSTKVQYCLPIIQNQIRNQTLISFTIKLPLCIAMLTMALISAISVSFTLGDIYTHTHLYMHIKFKLFF